MQNAPTAPAYAKLIEAGGLATVRGVALTEDDRLRRDVIERLMCDLEVDIAAIAKAHAADPAPLSPASTGSRASKPTASRIGTGAASQVSEQGRPFVRSVAALFDAYLTQDADKPRHSRAV